MIFSIDFNTINATLQKYFLIHTLKVLMINTPKSVSIVCCFGYFCYYSILTLKNILKVILKRFNRKNNQRRHSYPYKI